MNAKRIIEPIFYVEAINPDRYVRLIRRELFAQLAEEKRPQASFRQNSTAQTAVDFLAALEVLSGDRVINRGLWPTRSPNLTPYNFYL